MKLLLAIESGFLRTLRAWKVMLLFWFVSLLLVSMIVVPLKSIFKSALGDSMITEKIVKGIDVDMLGDLGTNLNSMLSYLSGGILIISFAALLVNVFIAGGIFHSLRNGDERFSFQSFFGAAAKNFIPFFVISLMLSLLIAVLLVVLLVIPLSYAVDTESVTEGMVLKTLVFSLSISVLAVSVIILVADYSRAWQVSHSQNDGLRAIFFGFRQTFRTFRHSYPLMLIMIALQAFSGWAAVSLIAGFSPSGASGIFLLFIISQLIFLFKIFFKVFRYASVISIMEQDVPGV